MSSDYYGHVAGEIADTGESRRYWPCCAHCDHDPGFLHRDPCVTCHFGNAS